MDGCKFNLIFFVVFFLIIFQKLEAAPEDLSPIGEKMKDLKNLFSEKILLRHGNITNLTTAILDNDREFLKNFTNGTVQDDNPTDSQKPPEKPGGNSSFSLPSDFLRIGGSIFYSTLTEIDFILERLSEDKQKIEKVYEGVQDMVSLFGKEEEKKRATEEEEKEIPNYFKIYYNKKFRLVLDLAKNISKMEEELTTAWYSLDSIAVEFEHDQNPNDWKEDYEFIVESILQIRVLKTRKIQLKTEKVNSIITTVISLPRVQALVIANRPKAFISNSTEGFNMAISVAGLLGIPGVMEIPPAVILITAATATITLYSIILLIIECKDSSGDKKPTVDGDGNGNGSTSTSTTPPTPTDGSTLSPIPPVINFTCCVICRNMFRMADNPAPAFDLSQNCAPHVGDITIAPVNPDKHQKQVHCS